MVCMDQHIRELYRKAQQGDHQSAYQWYAAKSRITTDLVEQFKLMQELSELLYPGLMEQIKQIEEIQKLIEPPPVEQGEWTTEIWISDNTSGDGVGQHPDLRNSYGLRIQQVSGAIPDVFIPTVAAAGTSIQLD